MSLTPKECDLVKQVCMYAGSVIVIIGLLWTDGEVAAAAAVAVAGAGAGLGSYIGKRSAE
jgi:hypothetical protein